MEGVNDELQGLRAENQRLVRALEEAEDLAAAIRTQRVDAFVIETPRGQRVFAIDGANRPYRALIEEMHQGALTLGESGLILFCNRRFASMLGVRPEKIIATRLCEHLVAADQDVCDTLMRKAMSASAHGEMRLRSHSGVEVPVYVSLERLAPESGADLGAVITDLSEQIAHKQVVAAEDLARSILEQALDAMIVCNPAGVVLRCNQSARDLCGRNPLHERFDVVFPLRCVGRDGRIPFEAALDAPQIGVKAKLERPDGTTADLLLNAGPLRGPDAEVIGVVITLNDLSEHQRLLASEQAARAEAERANRLKDEFVATLSHELRTPLNAMLNWTHILRLNANLDPQIAEGLDVILRNGRTQAQLIADLFDTSRMLSGTLRFELQEIDAREVIEAAIKSVQPSIEQKRLRLSRSLAADAGTIAGDPARLQQVVWNLLTNAIKFTPAEGRIEVSLARDGAELVMRVQDTGRGIAPEFLAFVFDRFRQADASASRKTGGLGLGLAITKQIVELHGGTIEASSAGLDRGATFCVRLPIRSLARGDKHPGGNAESAAKAPPSLAPTALSGLRVLVVDDALDAREIVKRIMEDCGAHIVTASSVDDAVRALQQFVPDLVISDIGMPDRDGYELIHLLRSLDAERGGNAPAIALTAYARHEDRLQALRAGYNAHIAKPIDIAKLMATVASLVPR